MLETPQSDRTNRKTAVLLSGVIAVPSLLFALHSPLWLLGLPLAGLFYWYWRRRTVRRLKVIAAPLPAEIESTLQQHVVYFRALNETDQDRFRNLVKVFLDEVPITGIRTDVDAGTQALVAASAMIPIFGFHDWEYAGLGEVLIYPNAFGEDYRVEDGDGSLQRRTLGMVGVGHLSGVMILSKPDLWSGFNNPGDKHNVGIHEFAHLVDKADGSVDGLPPGVHLETSGPWIQWVGEELKHKPSGRSHIDSYAYTNEAEYFAVLSEYFFEAPDVLQAKAPKIYDMMQTMYHQNTRRFLSNVKRPKKVGRNSPCPCGSGKKYKHCCGLKP
ncbi:zinc-dependent peptidase [Stieleria sp. TO1_6]|uniref:zinc-dependent peptidase n=1 Tax=Stieleria tagensis TaxID=2956795 RepID=UPI00209BA924|nr:zinc-dependent peptidase [Stieleria tagensis]MCO8121943.1 zinc-dependent peptidase [Stieleria tagensis]